MRHKRRRGRERLWDVWDKPALAQELAKAVKRIGSQNEAAQKFGISQPLLSRLIAQKRDRIDDSTEAALRRLVPRKQHNALALTLLGPDARAAREYYSRWLEGSFWKYERASLAHYDRHGDFEPRYALSLFRELESGSLMQRVEAVCHKELATFYLRAARLGHMRDGRPSVRLLLALARTIEPLLCSLDSGGVEREPDELSDAELQSFVKAGLDRELILLRRAPDEFRFQEARQLADADRREKLRIYLNRRMGQPGSEDLDLPLEVFDPLALVPTGQTLTKIGVPLFERLANNDVAQSRKTDDRGMAAKQQSEDDEVLIARLALLSDTEARETYSFMSPERRKRISARVAARRERLKREKRSAGV